MITLKRGQYYHGFFLKVLAIACKVIFLFYIVPHMEDRVFSQYVYYLTISIFISRLICWGANDQIPIVVNKKRVHKLDFWALLFLILSAIFLIISVYFEIAAISIALIAIVMITETLLEGMLIILSMRTYEKLLNLPWILFIIILLFQPAYSSVELMNLYSLAYIITHVFIFFIFMDIKYNTLFKESYSIREIWSLLRGGYLKVINQLLLLVNIRGIILLPKFINGVIVSDAVALGITIAETVSTVFMVIVNRNFAFYCKGKIEIRTMLLKALRVSSLFFISGGLFSVCVFIVIFMNKSYFNLNIPLDKLNPFVLFCAFSLFSVTLGFIEIRNYHWANKKNEVLFLWILIASFFFQASLLLIWDVNTAIYIIPAVLMIALYLFLCIKLTPAKAKLDIDN